MAEKTHSNPVKTEAIAFAEKLVESARANGFSQGSYCLRVSTHWMMIGSTRYNFEDLGQRILSTQNGEILNYLQVSQFVASFTIKSILNKSGLPFEMTTDFGRQGDDLTATFTCVITPPDNA